MQCGVYVLMPLWHGKKLKGSYFTHIFMRKVFFKRERKKNIYDYLFLKNKEFALFSYFIS